MNTYRVKRVMLNKANNAVGYQNAVINASVVYCKGIKELRQYCGGHLHRQGSGYFGANGNIEYVAEKCNCR